MRLSAIMTSVALAVAFLLAATVVQADLISLDNLADGRIMGTSSGTPTPYNLRNFGTTTDMRAFTDYNTPSDHSNYQVSLVKFDIGDIPAGMVIQDATLKLTICTASSHGTADQAVDLDVYRVTKNWIEGTQNNAPGEDNWYKYDASNSWDNAGGDAVGTTGVQKSNPYASTATAANPAVGTIISWDVTDLVDEWYAGTYSNYGMLVMGPAPSVVPKYGRFFATKEHATAAYHPVLEVTYAPVPEPSTLALLGCGLVGLLAYAWRKRR